MWRNNVPFFFQKYKVLVFPAEINSSSLNTNACVCPATGKQDAMELDGKCHKVIKWFPPPHARKCFSESNTTAETQFSPVTLVGTCNILVCLKDRVSTRRYDPLK